MNKHIENTFLLDKQAESQLYKDVCYLIENTR